MDEIVSFGEWVKARRNQLRYSRTELAKQVGCSPVTLKKIERDERRPSAQIAELLAQHLQIPNIEQDNFMRRARGKFVAQFSAPTEMSPVQINVLVATEDAPKHNLPSQTTSFIGRASELAQIAQQLANPNCRLLTILATGGMGKTRLAIEAARAQLDNFTDGITYVSLAPTAATASNEAVSPLVGALARALRIAFHGGYPPKQQLFAYLRRREMLIVFDNFEHLLETAVFLPQLLQHAPDIKILITSRERLNLQEEWLFSLNGLPHTDDAASAVQLFAQRAQQVKVDFDLAQEKTAVLRICQLVEGMPLGLELAASWVLQLSCDEIADEIETEIDFLTTEMRNVPIRQRSLRAVFSYSWEKLSAKEQGVLQQLSVFRDGFERKAAKAVAGASLPILGKLVGKSLLSVGENGRYQMHELLRQFSAEKAAQHPSLSNQLQERHGHYYLTLVTEQWPKIKGPEILEGLATVDDDIDNFHAAVRWGIIQATHLFGENLSLLLYWYYELRGLYLEGEAMLDLIATHLAQHIRVENPSSTNARLMWTLYLRSRGIMEWRLGKLKEADKTLQQSLKFAPSHQGLTLSFLAIVAIYKGELERALKRFKEADTLLKQSDDRWLYAANLFPWEQLAQSIGKIELAQRLAEECYQISTDLGDQLLRTYAAGNLGRLAVHRGDLEQARTYLQERLTICRRLRYHTGEALVLRQLGNVARLQGNYAEARDYLRQSLSIIHKFNLLSELSNSHWEQGNIAVDEHDFELAISYFEKADPATMTDVGGPGWAALGSKNFDLAQAYFTKSLQKMLADSSKPSGLDAIVGLAYLEAQSGQLSRAAELLALAQHHSASNFEIKQKAQKLWDELSTELPADIISKAEETGRRLDLIKTAELLLADPHDATDN